MKPGGHTQLSERVGQLSLGPWVPFYAHWFAADALKHYLKVNTDNCNHTSTHSFSLNPAKETMWESESVRTEVTSS